MSTALIKKPVWKTAVQWLTILLLTVGLGELIARCYAPPRLSWMFEEHKKTINIMGFQRLNEILEPNPSLFWRLKKNLDHFPVYGHFRNHYLHFFVSTHNHLRTSVFDTDHVQRTVLALGDSCTFGFGVNDDETWPAQLQMRLHQQGMKTRVINAGVPGYSAFQGKRFLENNHEHLHPDLVLACFGFNDREQWDGFSDIQVAHWMRAWYQEPMFKNSRMYVATRYLVYKLYFSIRHYLRNAGRSQTRPRLSRKEYQETIRGIKSICDQNDIPLVCLIWPYHSQVFSRSERLGFYQKYTAEVCRQEQIEVINLPRPFIKENRLLFIDHIHANADGCRLVAKTVLPHVVRQLETVADNPDISQIDLDGFARLRSRSWSKSTASGLQHSRSVRGNSPEGRNIRVNNQEKRNRV